MYDHCNFWEFIIGKKDCYECGGTGLSPRGYGDQSGCGSCYTGKNKIQGWEEKGSGKIKVDRVAVIKRLLRL